MYKLLAGKGEVKLQNITQCIMFDDFKYINLCFIKLKKIYS